MKLFTIYLRLIAFQVISTRSDTAFVICVLRGQ